MHRNSSPKYNRFEDTRLFLNTVNPFVVSYTFPILSCHSASRRFFTHLQGGRGGGNMGSINTGDNLMNSKLCNKCIAVASFARCFRSVGYYIMVFSVSFSFQSRRDENKLSGRERRANGGRGRSGGKKLESKSLFVRVKQIISKIRRENGSISSCHKILFFLLFFLLFLAFVPIILCE